MLFKKKEQKKYELTSDFVELFDGRKLFRIKALVAIEKYGVSVGDLGGYIEKEENLCHDGDAWVYGNAEVYGNARVSGNAEVSGNARVYGDADYMYIHGLGTVHRTTTAFKCKDGIIRISCGCFYGTIEEFRKQVDDTREGKVVKEYLAFADLLEIYFEIDKEKEK